MDFHRLIARLLVVVGLILPVGAAELTFTNLTQMLSFPTTGIRPNTTITLLGRTVEGDGGGGQFYFSTNVDTSSLVFAAGSNGVYFPGNGGGHFVRNWVSPISPAWWGAQFLTVSNQFFIPTNSVGVLTNDVTIPVQKSVDYASAIRGETVELPPGLGITTRPIYIGPWVKFRGASEAPPNGFTFQFNRTNNANLLLLSALRGYPEGATNGAGFPLLVADGRRPEFDNAESECFVNWNGETVCYKFAGIEISGVAMFQSFWGWNTTNALPVAAIAANEIDGLNIYNCAAGDITGYGLYLRGVRGLKEDNNVWEQALVMGKFMTDTSDTLSWRNDYFLSSIFIFRANTHILDQLQIYNPFNDLIASGGQTTNLVFYGNTRSVLIERTAITDASDDTIRFSLINAAGTEFLGAGFDTSVPVRFYGTPPAPFVTNQVYFGVNVPNDHAKMRLAISPGQALLGNYLDITESTTNKVSGWAIAGFNQQALTVWNAEEIFIRNLRADQSYDDAIELTQVRRSTVADSQIWEIALDGMPARFNRESIHPSSSGISISDGNDIQITGNRFQNHTKFNTALARRIPSYGVKIQRSQDILVAANGFQALSYGVWYDEHSANITAQANSMMLDNARLVYSPAPNISAPNQWRGIEFMGTNYVNSDLIPAGYTNLTDFTWRTTLELGTMRAVANGDMYSPVGFITSTTNAADLGPYVDRSFGLTFYKASGATNTYIVGSFQGPNTNDFRRFLVNVSEWVDNGTPFEFAVTRTGGNWLLFINTTQFTPSWQTAGTPPALDAPIHANYLQLGVWPRDIHRSGWIFNTSLATNGLSASEIINAYQYKLSTNTVLSWIMPNYGDTGKTLDSGPLGIDGNIFSRDNSIPVNLGPTIEPRPVAGTGMSIDYTDPFRPIFNNTSPGSVERLELNGTEVPSPWDFIDGSQTLWGTNGFGQITLTLTNLPSGSSTNVADGDYGDITVSGGGTNWQVNPNVLTTNEFKLLIGEDIIEAGTNIVFTTSGNKVVINSTATGGGGSTNGGVLGTMFFAVTNSGDDLDIDTSTIEVTGVISNSITWGGTWDGSLGPSPDLTLHFVPALSDTNYLIVINGYALSGEGFVVPWLVSNSTDSVTFRYGDLHNNASGTARFRIAVLSGELGGGGGGGSTEQLIVNGVVKTSPWYLTNSTTVVVSTNANGHIQWTATGTNAASIKVEGVDIVDPDLVDTGHITFTNSTGSEISAYVKPSALTGDNIVTNSIQMDRLQGGEGVWGNDGTGFVIMQFLDNEFLSWDVTAGVIEADLNTTNLVTKDALTNQLEGLLIVDGGLSTPEFHVTDFYATNVYADAINIGTNTLEEYVQSLVTDSGSGASIILDALNQQAPSSDFGSLVNRGSTPNLLLSYGNSVDQCNYWTFWIPEDWNLTNGLDVTVVTYTTSATSGTNVYEVAFDYLVGQDIDTDSFDTGALFLSEAAGTSGIATIVTQTMTDLDGAAPGGHVKVAGCRLPGNASDNIDEAIQLQLIALRPADP